MSSTFPGPGNLDVFTQDQPVLVKRAGTADIIGFGHDGTYILRNSVRPDVRLVSQSFTYTEGWRKEQHLRVVGDTTGDGLADIIGFGNPGTYTSRNNGDNSFGPIVLKLSAFGTDQGWDNTKHVRYAIDLRKKGYVDLVGFGARGVYVAKNNGDGTFAPATLVLSNFGYDNDVGTWRTESHLRFFADTTGNGLPDIVAFGGSQVFSATNKGDGTFNPIQALNVNSFTTTQNWVVNRHPRTLADLTGDKRADIIGFGTKGVWVAYNNGNGTFRPAQLVLNEFGTDGGWDSNLHPRFVVDLTGDGRADIIGFGNTGVWVAKNNGNGTFQPSQLVMNAFGVSQTWQVGKHPRFVVDLTGDGCADIIGFGWDAVYVAYNKGDGTFGEQQKLTSGNFSYNDGQWDIEKTVRWVANLF
ncbi:Psathyrella Velutina lectin At 1.5a resolution [Agrocybe pediades]|nr:Psathyrella Velutina lectin At 1.5a resolution [Agrocybe pediades]